MQDGKGIVVNKIEVRQLQRVKEDIASWLQAITTAENVRTPRRQRLIEIYRRVMLDSFTAAMIQRRVQAVTNTAIFVKNAQGQQDDKAIAEAEKPWFKKMISFALEARFWGHSLIEPYVQAGEIVNVKLVPRHHVRPEIGHILVRPSDTSGVAYRKGALSRQLLEVGDAEDLGILMRVAPNVLYKQGLMGDWSHFAELFGMPIREYKYNPHDPTSRQEVENQAKNMGSAAYLLVPEGVELKLHQLFNAAGTAALYGNLRQALNNEIAISILGQTLTSSNEESGAYSLGKVHQDEQDRIHTDDLHFIERVLNYTGRAFLEYWGVALPEGYYYEFDRTEHLSVAQRIDVDTKLNALVPISPAYFYERYNVPPPTAQEQAEIDARKAAVAQQMQGREGQQQGKGGQQQDPTDDADTEPAATVDLPAWYDTHDACCGHEPQAVYRNKLVAAFAAFIRAVFDGFTGVHEPLMVATAAELVRGWETSYQLVNPDYDVGVRRNIYAFSGAKTLDQLIALREAVYQNGRKVPYTEFRAFAQTIWQQYHEGYLEAEYNQVVRAGTMSQKWQRIERTKNLYPYLEYKTEGDGRVRPEHAALEGIVRPVNDPFWESYYPPNGWRCRCSVRQVTLQEIVSGEKTITADDDAIYTAMPQVDRYWRGNVGKTGLIFRDDHPYFRRLDDASRQQIDRIFRNAQAQRP